MILRTWLECVIIRVTYEQMPVSSLRLVSAAESPSFKRSMMGSIITQRHQLVGVALMPWRNALYKQQDVDFMQFKVPGKSN